MELFKSLSPEQLEGNPFDLIGNQWFLITPSHQQINPMTASWGSMGIMWHKPVVMVVIRPQRHTFKLMEETISFSLSFLSESHRNILKFCGANSGKDVDKIKETGLTPFKTDNGLWGYEEAQTILECRKVFAQDYDPGSFIDETIFKQYPNEDYHRLYMGEVLSVLTR